MKDYPFGRRLKEARLALGLSQKKLGMLAHIEEFTASARMNQYEKNKHHPDFGTVKRIARVLKVPTAYFYAEEDALAQAILRCFPLIASVPMNSSLEVTNAHLDYATSLELSQPYLLSDELERYQTRLFMCQLQNLIHEANFINPLKNVTLI